MESAKLPCEKKTCFGCKWMTVRPTPASSRKVARSKVMLLTPDTYMARPGCGLHGSGSEGYATASDLRKPGLPGCLPGCTKLYTLDRKSTRLNSSHLGISYAVF